MESAVSMFTTLVGFVLLAFVWRMLKNTIRELARDALIDLRDEWRRFYVENGYDMQDGAYAKVRDLLNGMLRYTKRMRMIGYLYFSTHVSKEVVDNSAAEFQAVLNNVRPEVAEKAEQIRNMAARNLIGYMGATSISFLSAVIIAIVYLLPSKIIEWVKNGLKTLIDFKPDTIGCAVMCPA